VADNGETRTDKEVLEMRFEYFKHLTTVSTAATLAVVAVYGSLKESLELLALTGAGFLGIPRRAADELAMSVPIIAVCGFLFSLVVSLRGMYLVADSRSVDENYAAIARMSRWSVVSFILGASAAALVGAFVLDAVVTVSVLLILVAIVVPISVVLLIFVLIRRIVRAFRGRGTDNTGRP
jgi:cytochrome bd-type quinol oxidase subunit 2